jgi:hypothetical protein
VQKEEKSSWSWYEKETKKREKKTNENYKHDDKKTESGGISNVEKEENAMKKERGTQLGSIYFLAYMALMAAVE